MHLYMHLYLPLLFSACIVTAGYVVAWALNGGGIDPGPPHARLRVCPTAPEGIANSGTEIMYCPIIRIANAFVATCPPGQARAMKPATCAS